MCLGIPYRVLEIMDGDSCLIEADGGVEHCFLGMVEDVEPGDWIVVQSFFAVEKIDAQEARERRNLIERYVFGDENGVEAGEVTDRARGE